MTNKKIHQITAEGYQTFVEELKELQEVRRPANIEALAEARALGDLSENAELDSARNEQTEIETRINELEYILENHVIIEVKTIRVLFLDKDEEKTFKIVGGVEADPFNGKISEESPLGRAIMTHQEGDVVEFESVAGRPIRIQILEFAK